MLIFALFLHEKHDAVTSGKAYGYEIGQSQKPVFERIKSLAPKEDYKVLYVSYQAGMNSQIDILPISELSFEDIAIGRLSNYHNRSNKSMIVVQV